MELFTFGQADALPITAFDSISASLARGLRTADATQLGCLYLGPGGILGRHPATVSQLLMVVAGQGWVEGGDGQRVVIQAGEAAFWQVGESHTTATEDGLTAVVVEAMHLDPGAFMPCRTPPPNELPHE